MTLVEKGGSMNLRFASKMLNERNIAFWESISQKNIEILRNNATSAFFYKYFYACVKFIVLISFIAGAAFISQNGVVTLRAMTGSWTDYGIQILCIVVQFAFIAAGIFFLGCFVFLLCFSFARDLFGDAYGLIEELTPLSQTKEECSRALEYIDIPECAQYRNKVLSNGRELLFIDFLLMGRIAKKVRKAQLNSKSDYEHELACKKLHGLS